MMIGRGGAVESDASHADTGFGASEILAFRYDVGQARFERVSGRSRAFLGYSRADWLSADFLENTLTRSDRDKVAATLDRCMAGEQIVCDCTLVNAHGTDVPAVIAADALDPDPTQITGQIILLGSGAIAARRMHGGQVVHIDLMRVLVGWLSHQTRSMSGFGELLTRHLGTQGDDVGAEYVLGIRNTTALLEQAVNKLRPLTAGRPDEDDVAEAVDFLMREIRTEGAARPGG